MNISEVGKSLREAFMVAAANTAKTIEAISYTPPVAIQAVNSSVAAVNHNLQPISKLLGNALELSASFAEAVTNVSQALLLNPTNRFCERLNEKNLRNLSREDLKACKNICEDKEIAFRISKSRSGNTWDIKIMD